MASIIYARWNKKFDVILIQAINGRLIMSRCEAFSKSNLDPKSNKFKNKVKVDSLEQRKYKEGFKSNSYDMDHMIWFVK